jgi:1-acyl-sn-glycerol-3-phosphate acyltransferase
VKVPPKPVRRVVLAPIVVLVEALLVLLSPLLLIVALVLSPLAGGWRPLRAVLIVLSGTTRHMAAITACFALWVASGFGRRMETEGMRRAHYNLMRWFVRGVYDVIVALAHVRVVVVDSDEAGAVLSARDRPVLLFGRHAGEGDTLLVLYELLCPHRRGPRIVMHERLRLDPFVDVLGERLPNRFVDPRGGDTERDIAAMAAELDDGAALVLFPEGRNFSAAHRQRAIDRLQQAGHAEEAERAGRMRQVSAPRPGGALAAIDACPRADVVVMGHVGFPDGIKDVWRHLPDEQVITVRLWHEPADRIPERHDERIAWLFDRWQQLDDWVVENGEGPPGGGPSHSSSS